MKIYNELESGVPDGFVTDHTQVRGVTTERYGYTELKAIKDAGQLIPGRRYIIDDYRGTKSAEVGTEMMSASFYFGIIVTAVTDNQFSETAWACPHSRDLRSGNFWADFKAWELKYCFDNDTSRFAWAIPDRREAAMVGGKEYIYTNTTIKGYHRFMADDGEYVYSKARRPGNGEFVLVEDENGGIIMTTRYFDPYQYELITGRGIIYYLKDEFGNECPYDFKNILFDGKYTFDGGMDGSGYPIDDSRKTARFNVMEPCFDNGRQVLNRNVLGAGAVANRFGRDAMRNTLGQSCQNNSFGDYCSDNVLELGCERNTFGVRCEGNTLGMNAKSNHFADLCRDNVIGANSSYNNYGDAVIGNTLGTGCSFNTLRQYCYNNVLGDGLQYADLRSGTKDMKY